MRQHKSVGSGEETGIDRLGDEATCGSLTGRRLKLRVEGDGAAITGANGIALDIQDKGRINCRRPRSTEWLAWGRSICQEKNRRRTEVSSSAFATVTVPLPF